VRLVQGTNHCAVETVIGDGQVGTTLFGEGVDLIRCEALQGGQDGDGFEALTGDRRLP